MTSHRTKVRRALATAIGIAALAAAASGGGVFAAREAAPSFTAPAYDMTIGGPGHAFVYPWGMAWDPTSDTILTSDYNNYQVQRFSPSGTQLAVYSSKSALGGEQPYGIAVDTDLSDPYSGSFVVDNIEGYLRYSCASTSPYACTLVDTVDAAPDAPNGFGAVYAPFVAINPVNGTVYLVSSVGLDTALPNIVMMFSNTDQYEGYFGVNGSSCSGQFGLIRGIDVDSEGNVYVDGVSSHCVEEWDGPVDCAGPGTTNCTGSFVTSFSTKTTKLPSADQTSSNTRGLAIDRTNNLLYLADAGKQDVEVYNIAPGSDFGKFEGIIGTPGTTVGDLCGGSGELDGPRGVAIGPAGTVYVSDYACFTIDAFNPLFASSDPGAFLQPIPDPPIAPPAGGFNDAVGVAVSPLDDTVYVSDTFNLRIQEFDGPDTPGGTPGAFVQTWGHRDPVLNSYCAMDYPRELPWIP